MNLSKRPIADTALRFNSTLYMVMPTSFNKENAEFGSMVQDNYNYHALEYGIVKSIRETEDKEGMIVVLLRVDKDGKERPELNVEDATIEVTIPYKQENVTFKPGVWCDDKKLALELRNEKNREGKARMERIAKAVQDNIDFFNNLIDIEE